MRGVCSLQPSGGEQSLGDIEGFGNESRIEGPLSKSLNWGSSHLPSSRLSSPWV